MAWYIFISSAKSRYMQYLIMRHKSLTYMLKNRGPRTDPCGTWDGTSKCDEIVPEIWTWDCLLVR
jgi:hypothetical protein